MELLLVVRGSVTTYEFTVLVRDRASGMKCAPDKPNIAAHAISVLRNRATAHVDVTVTEILEVGISNLFHDDTCF